MKDLLVVLVMAGLWGVWCGYWINDLVPSLITSLIGGVLIGLTRFKGEDSKV